MLLYCTESLFARVFPPIFVLRTKGICTIHLGTSSRTVPSPHVAQWDYFNNLLQVSQSVTPSESVVRSIKEKGPFGFSCYDVYTSNTFIFKFINIYLFGYRNYVIVRPARHSPALSRSIKEKGPFGFSCYDVYTSNTFIFKFINIYLFVFLNYVIV
jgi:hypothetical protein